MKTNNLEHYFINPGIYKEALVGQVACVKCGLNFRYLNIEPFCKEKGSYKNLLTGTFIRNNYRKSLLLLENVITYKK
jgi:hypothetical protein